MSTGTSPQPCVLVAEHEASVRSLLEQTLQLEHYRTDAATTLEEACEKAEDELYDLVLTDLFSSFPPQLTAVGRLQQRCHPTPVGILSAWPIKQKEAERAGFAFVLQKPFDLDRLLEHIASRLTPLLSPLEQAQAELIRVCLSALNDRHWEALRALLTPEVTYVPLMRSLSTTQAILGQEAVLSYVQQVVTLLPGLRIDHRLLLPHPQQLVTRFRSSWQGPNGQRQHLTGMALFRFHGERISQVGLSMNRRRFRELVEPG